MGEIVYSLCALTSLVCAILLTRSWKRTGERLLMWSSVCFVGLFVNNVVLFIDLVVLPTQIDLSLVRAATAFVAVLALVVGLVWSSK